PGADEDRTVARSDPEPLPRNVPFRPGPGFDPMLDDGASHPDAVVALQRPPLGARVERDATGLREPPRQEEIVGAPALRGIGLVHDQFEPPASLDGEPQEPERGEDLRDRPPRWVVEARLELDHDAVEPAADPRGTEERPPVLERHAHVPVALGGREHRDPVALLPQSPGPPVRVGADAAVPRR